MARLGRKRIDWRRVQARYDAGVGARSCMALFGISPPAWTAAAESGLLRTRPHGIPFESLLEGRRSPPPGDRRRAPTTPIRCRAATKRAQPPDGP